MAAAKGPVVLQPGLLLVRPQYTPNPDTGDHPLNVLWFVSTITTGGAVSIGQLGQMAGAFDPAWANVTRQYMGSGHAYLGSSWTDYSTTFGLSYSSVGTFTPVTGSGTESLPANVSILTSLKINERYKGGHGRIYWPWVGANAQDPSNPDHVNATLLTNLTSAFSSINTATLNSGVLQGQSQRVYRDKQNPATAHLMQISTFNFNVTFATQRRRLRKAPHR